MHVLHRIMGTLGTYYFDGNSFQTATAVYTNATLTTLAPDGYYAGSGVVRQQLNGILLSASNCDQCLVACDTGVSVSISNTRGWFDANINVGNDTGAVVLYAYLGATIPDGIIAYFNSLPYKRLTCNDNHNGVTLVNGAGATVDYAGILSQNNVPTYVGASNSQLITGSPHTNIDEYELISGTYSQTGATRTITVVNSQVGTASSGSPTFTMVIPKNVITQDVLNLQIFAPLNGTLFRWQISCPQDLVAFKGSVLGNTTACGTNDQDYYFVRNATGTAPPFTVDTNTLPEIGNFVFTQSDGSIYLNDTNTLKYFSIPGGLSLGVRNGVIVSSSLCSGGASRTAYASSVNGVFNDVCAGNPVANQTYYHDGNGVLPAVSDVVFPAASGATTLTAGYYYLGGTSPNRIYIVVDSNGLVTTVGNC